MIYKGPALLAGFFILNMLTGCATYQGQVSQARQSLESGQPLIAIDLLKPLAEKEGKDRLVYLLDLGTTYQVAEQWAESNRTFLAADRLSEQVDYHSVTAVSGSLLLSEEMVQYKGDTFEKFFINAYLAMNFLALGDFDSALVEARRINQKYLKFRAEEAKSFQQNTFGLWLSGVAWEATGSYDDAFIAYKNAWDLNPDNAVISRDLLRAAKLARRQQEYQKLRARIPNYIDDSMKRDRNSGEVIILVQQGWGPRKEPDPGSPRFPILRSVYSQTQKVEARVQDRVMASELVYQVDEAARRTLQEDYDILVAKRLGGYVAKEVVADQIRQKDELLGFIAQVAMHASDRADLRQWSFLPETIQVIRLQLPIGEHSIELRGLDGYNSATGELKLFEKVQVSPLRPTFLIWRTVR